MNSLRSAPFRQAARWWAGILLNVLTSSHTPVRCVFKAHICHTDRTRSPPRSDEDTVNSRGSIDGKWRRGAHPRARYRTVEEALLRTITRLEYSELRGFPRYTIMSGPHQPIGDHCLAHPYPCRGSSIRITRAEPVAAAGINCVSPDKTIAPPVFAKTRSHHRRPVVHLRQSTGSAALQLHTEHIAKHSSPAVPRPPRYSICI